ncbi:ABC transporter substrate-binding protein [uncultured Cohaesibacter sp.]|uniref:ABC transporter substrate-binding protein n=1 Tax=uncultured Cohaesibacter sp. TaxID=1002546 RepID=UPI00292E663F|nr:ABC transporter substrate-binding protein [uncultured Cohaesibacter sp.]
MKIRFLFATALALASFSLPASARVVNDALGVAHDIPDTVDHVICSGAGCLRLLSYLGVEDRVVGVDGMEKRKSPFDSRPYALANPGYKNLPLFGQHLGRDNPELIMALDPAPQVIFKAVGSSGLKPETLEQKTQIPVIAIQYGDLDSRRDQFYQALEIMGEALDRKERAAELIAFFKETRIDLETRASASKQQAPSIFVGGISYRGSRGLASTDPAYAPFSALGLQNFAASKTEASGGHATTIAKEKLLEWDPDIILLDLATLQLGPDAGGQAELKNDPAYQILSAREKGQVWGVLPYALYTKNYGSILADAYFIGKLVYPDSFEDIDPASKADEIYSFLFGKPVFNEMNSIFNELVFRRVPVQ